MSEEPPSTTAGSAGEAAAAAGARTGGPEIFDRAHALGRMAGEQFDVLVVGGGVTGAGVALDAASRGLRTALVERGDFASGTSSRSSKLVHGGLRYLQQHEIRLVYENLAERQRLLRNAPHLVSPLPFLIPLFGRDGTVARAVARSYSSALWLYDLTGGLRIGSRHRRLPRAEVLAHFPLLRTDRLVAGFLYLDARADDARLTLSLLRTAALDHGAAVANYTALDSFVTGPSGRVAGGVVRPAVMPGAGAGPSFPVRARVVVNATGVWADDVRALGEVTHPHSLRPAKGVHVTVPADRLPCDVAAVIPAGPDRRSIFVVPWPEGGLVYLGTTDTAYAGPLDDPRCTSEDVAYLLRAVNDATTAALTPDDVTGVWAGLRPLLASSGGRRMTERTADLSRRHKVIVGENGVVTVTGGKLTTYRKMAQDAVDEVVRALPPARRAGRAGRGGRLRCVTRRLALRGSPGPEAPVMAGSSSAAPGPRAAGSSSAALRAHLVARYGRESGDVLAIADGRPDLLEPVVEHLPYVGAEIVYAARSEMAQTLADVATRRTRALIQRAEATLDAAPAIATLLARELGWTREEEHAELERFRGGVSSELRAAGLVRSDPSGVVGR